MTGFHPSVRTLIYERDGMQCVRCWSRHNLQAHHRAPRKMGGTSRAWINQAANVILLCQACHEHVERNRSWAYRHGFLIRMGDDEADEIPITLPSGTYWLTNDGQKTLISRRTA